MAAYRTVPIYDETTEISKDQWTLEFREPEFCAFQLVLHDYQSSLTWTIVESRTQRYLAEIEFHRRLYTTWKRLITIYPEKSFDAHYKATAIRWNTTPEQVKTSIYWIATRGIPEVN